MLLSPRTRSLFEKYKKHVQRCVFKLLTSTSTLTYQSQSIHSMLITLNIPHSLTKIFFLLEIKFKIKPRKSEVTFLEIFSKKKICGGDAIRTRDVRTRLRPERSALDHSATPPMRIDSISSYNNRIVVMLFSLSFLEKPAFIPFERMLQPTMANVLQWNTFEYIVIVIGWLPIVIYTYFIRIQRFYLFHFWYDITFICRFFEFYSFKGN